MNEHDLKEILRIGICAISTCNNQPWRFRMCGEELHVFMLRTKNFFLKLEGNTWIELGTMLENLSMAALSKGYAIDYSLYERYGLDEAAAIVRFIPGQGVPVNLDAVLRRCTNRAYYSEQPLDFSVKESIFKACEFEEIEIRILEGRRKNRCAKILNQLRMCAYVIGFCWKKFCRISVLMRMKSKNIGTE